MTRSCLTVCELDVPDPTLQTLRHGLIDVVGDGHHPSRAYETYRHSVTRQIKGTGKWHRRKDVHHD